MKLRNKKTEKIGELHYDPDKEYHFVVATEDPADMRIYKSLAELNEKWEDVPEEPKTHWMIDTSVLEPVREIAGRPYEIDKEIGNWFAAREEAEKAVEKLKAWKRLKDKGFRFDGYNSCSVDYDIDEKYRRYISEDLDTLFGGKE